MTKKYIIYGASSFVANELIKQLSKNNKVIAFSRKKLNLTNLNLKFFKTNYDENHILKILKKNIKEKDIPVFIFFNAISDNSALIKMKRNEILDIFRINLITPILITNIIIKNFLNVKPHFIYMSSTRGHMGDKGISIYSTTKNGLAAFTKNMSIEYGSFGLNFRVILLGLVNGGLKNKINKDKIIKKIILRTPNEKYIKIKEILKTIKYIENDKTGNGSIINCDNGYY